MSSSSAWGKTVITEMNSRSKPPPSRVTSWGLFPIGPSHVRRGGEHDRVIEGVPIIREVFDAP